MAGRDKWIRPLKDNAAGKVVQDGAWSRWEWDSALNETAGQLRKLQNDELAIEQTNIMPHPHAAKGSRGARSAVAGSPYPKSAKKPGGRDPGGGFNPYDNSGKPRRR